MAGKEMYKGVREEFNVGSVWVEKFSQKERETQKGEGKTIRSKRWSGGGDINIQGEWRNGGREKNRRIQCP